MSQDVVLGVDPGGTTGLCLLRVDPLEIINYDQVPWPEVLDVAEEWWVGRCAAVACERYVITARTAQLTQQPEALMVIGAFFLLARKVDLPMTLQSVGDAKAAFSNEYLNELGLRVKGKHARDALRHACLCVRRAYGTSTLV